MRIFTNLINACLIFLMLSLCSCFKQQQLLFKERGPNPDSLSAALKNSGNGTSDYRIQSQDILQIRNLQNIKYLVEETPTLNGASGGGGSVSQQGQTYQVEDDGTVALPVIGRIHVAGLTRTEAMKLIEEDNGHAGPLYVILPDSYAGPKEKFVLKSFPGYKEWYGEKLSDKYVLYQAP